MITRRIDFLDGLRGLAIILVILFHAYARWSKFVPYEKTFANILFFKYGYLGVQLFFLISGFVILLSLDNSKNFKSFIYKRWLRLFPTMLIASILIYTSAAFFYERPNGIPKIESVIPGLLFIDPALLKFFGVDIKIIEGAFWSLFVEVKFYIIFGGLYFTFGRKKSILYLVMISLIAIVSINFRIKGLSTLSILLSLKYFGWFATGCFTYLYYIERNKKYIIFGLFLTLLNIYFFRKNNPEIIFSLIILIIFISPVIFEKIRTIFNIRFLKFFGFISYPLYLIHENAMIAMIIKLNNFFEIPMFLLPLLPVAFLCMVSYFIASKLEDAMKKRITETVNYIDKKLA